MKLRLLRRIRQNHALEHATISVLLKAGTPTPLGGYATRGGFFVWGRTSTEALTEAADQALARLQDGQRELAVSPYCGTNLLVGAVVAGLLSGLIFGRRRGAQGGFLSLVAAITGATLLGRPLGNAIQRRYTTLADVDGLEISEVKRLKGGNFTIHQVHTRVAAVPSS